jgi:cardiolipin synthase A/B
MFFPFVPDPISFSDPFDWRMALRITAHVAFVLALLSIPSVVMKRRGRPQSALTWVLILLTVPILGLFLWWAIGRTHLARKRKKKRKAAKFVSQKLDKLLAPEPKMKSEWQLIKAIELPADDAEWVFPATHGNHVQLLENAEEAYPALESLIKNAEHHIHCMFYIWNRDATGEHFRDLLIEKARQGVEVRVLLDAFGASKTAGRFMNPLREAGGEVRLFGRAVWLQRNLEFNFRNPARMCGGRQRSAYRKQPQSDA